MRHSDQSLLRPIFAILVVLDFQQHPEASRSVRPIQFCPIRIGKAMVHAAAVSLGPVAKEPRIACVGREYGRKRDLVPRTKYRRIDGKTSNGTGWGRELRLRCAS